MADWLKNEIKICKDVLRDYKHMWAEEGEREGDEMGLMVSEFNPVDPRVRYPVLVEA